MSGTVLEKLVTAVIPVSCVREKPKVATEESEPAGETIDEGTYPGLPKNMMQRKKAHYSGFGKC